MSVMAVCRNLLTFLPFQAEHALSELKQVPTNIERTISTLEKQGKELDKDAGDSAKADKLIRQLFEKLA